MYVNIFILSGKIKIILNNESDRINEQTINEQNKAEKTNRIYLLINSVLIIIFFQGSGMWLCCKWKEAYDCPNICCNCHVYNFKITANQIVLHHFLQIISLNQMIWNSMLKTSKTNQLSWYKSSQIISGLNFRRYSHGRFQLKKLLFSINIASQTRLIFFKV